MLDSNLCRSGASVVLITIALYTRSLFGVPCMYTATLEPEIIEDLETAVVSLLRLLSTFVLPSLQHQQPSYPLQPLFHLTKHPKPRTESAPSTPKPPVKPLQPHPLPSASGPHSPQRTTCSLKTHCCCPHRTRLADCSHSAGSPRSPAGSQEQACNRAEARRVRTPWVVLDKCRRLGREGGLTLEGRLLVLGDDCLSFRLCWLLVLKMSGEGGRRRR